MKKTVKIKASRTRKPKAQEPKKVGPKVIQVLYKPIMAQWCRLICARWGATVEDLAKWFGVHEQTFYRWMREHPELKDAVRAGRDEFDNSVAERSLMVRVTGVTYDEVTEEVNSKGETSHKVVKKWLPPDVGAIRHWLNNRDPERWKDKTEHEHRFSELEDALREAEERLRKDERRVEGRSKVEMEPGQREE